jgi:hypothetical protein
MSVAMTPGWVVAACEDGGLAIIDVAKPAAPRLQTVVNVFGSALSVAAANGLAYVGTEQGELIVVDLAAGVVLSRTGTGGRAHDVDRVARLGLCADGQRAAFLPD